MPALPKSTITPADAQIWRKAFLDLRPSVSPCPGLTGENWTAIHAKGVDFLERWADQAVALGWTTLDLWGVHPEIGTIRSDFCGAMVMGNQLVTGIAEQRVYHQTTTFYRDTPGRPMGAIPIWAFRG